MPERDANQPDGYQPYVGRWPERDANQLARFDVQVYGSGGGVAYAYPVCGDSAEQVARSEAFRLRHNIGLESGAVGVWAQDRKSGHASVAIPSRYVTDEFLRGVADA